MAEPTKLTGVTQTQIQPVTFRTVGEFLQDLLGLLGQPHAAEVHLAMVPQPDGGLVAQGAVIHRQETADRPVVAVVGDDEGS